MQFPQRLQLVLFSIAIGNSNIGQSGALEFPLYQSRVVQVLRISLSARNFRMPVRE